VAEDPHAPRVTSRRRKAIGAGVLLVAIGAVALGVVITTTTAPTSRAAAISYCSASRRVDEYGGHDRTHLAVLLERVQRRAPAEIAPVVAAMRVGGPTSAGFRAATSAWNRYNTDHCCTCLGNPSLPQLVSTRP
jgi:hypothetical protein